MSSTFTSRDGYEKIGIGEQPDSWGATLNNNADLMDQSCDGISTAVLTTNTYTITVTPGVISNGRSRVIIFTGSYIGTTFVNIQPNNIQKVYWIVNQSTATVVISNGFGTSVVVSPNTTAPAFCDGSGSVTGLLGGNDSFSSLIVTGRTDLSSLTYIAGQVLSSYISGFVGDVGIAIEAVAGGTYVIATFGALVGSRTRLAFGIGQNVSNGFVIPVPTGFSAGNLICGATLNSSVATAGNSIGRVLCQTSGTAVIVATSDQTGGINYPTTANWWSIAWRNGY